MAPQEDPQLSPALLAELSAHADGTLSAGRRAEVEARIAASPQLRSLYERERKVVERLHETRAADRAPDRLRARLAAQRPSRGSHARRRTLYAGTFAGALAAFGLALAVVLPAGTPGSPSVSQAAALALRGPVLAAPRADAGDPRNKLALRLQDVYFPNWSTTLGWRAVGARIDRLERRPAITVFYSWRGRRLAYTIVGAPALSQPSGRVTRLNGYELHTLDVNGRTVITWRRAGRTCVLSAKGVPALRLRILAAWRGSSRSG